MLTKVLFIACVASAASELEFTDSSGTCTITKVGTTLENSCALKADTLTVNGKNIGDELELLNTRVGNLETRVLNNENGVQNNANTIVAGRIVCPSGMTATSAFSCMSNSQWNNNMHAAEHHCMVNNIGSVCSYNDYTVACGAHYHNQLSFDPMANMNPGWLGDKTYADNYFVVSNSHGCGMRNYGDWDASHSGQGSRLNFRCCL
jgi:hypothetical protein